MFVHLRVHSEFSLIDSTLRLPELVAKARTLAMPALALTDELNVFALVKFVKTAEAAGIKPLIGADCWLSEAGLRETMGRSDAAVRHRFTLLCQNQTGYLNLCRLLSKAWVDRNSAHSPTLCWQDLSQAHSGLIALSGGYLGDVGKLLSSGRAAAAQLRAKRWAELFDGRYYVEVSRCGRELENELVPALAQLAEQLDLPLVATNDVRFLDSSEGVSDDDIDDFSAHEARVCIHEGYVLADTSRPKRTTREQYLKSPAEMQLLFSDLPAALSNTVEVAKRCNFSLSLGSYPFPIFPSAEGLPTDVLMAREARLGLQDRLQALQRIHLLAAPEDQYQQRLETEIAVINRMGFAGYFLIVSEFIRWAKQHAIPVGPGRGSGAGSLVAYALLITDLDPIRYELLFERFLNPERVSMPDFDVDFCMDRRDEVIRHVSELYGADKVSQIITYGTMAAKACVRDAGRVLSMSYGHTDSIAKLIPQTLGIELKDALAQSDELRALLDTDEEARGLIKMALKLEGLTRNAGKHAGGVVIAPLALTEFTALYSEGHDGDASAELPVTQFDKDDVEAIGLVKFDFLGLRTLTILAWAITAINTRRAQQAEPEAPLDLATLATDDPATYALLQSGRTTAVFQLESRGMKELARKLKPHVFDDIIALGALFRPGPLQSGMVDEFVERKHGRREVVYQHPLLEPVLKATYGVIVYQEQVMQIAQLLAGYTLGGADMLRRAMGKKNAQEMAQQRAIFTEGASNNGVDGALATAIFDLMEKFAEYGFNKSHSAAYAMLSYQTAYLKAHYPAEFMAAVLSSEADNTDKIVDFLADCRDCGVKILAPDVNTSLAAFSAQEGRMTIRYGLAAIKGVGHAVCEAIVTQRRFGAYLNLADFVQRVADARPNRRVLEALVDSGALDGLGAHRASLHANLSDAMKAAERLSRDAQSGQSDMFGAVLRRFEPAQQPLEVAPATLAELLAREKAVLGGYFSGHPLDEMREELDALGLLKIDALISRPAPKGRIPEQPVLVAGAIEAIRKRDAVAFARLSDGSGGKIEAGFFREAPQKFAHLLVDSQLVVIAGGLSWDAFMGAWQLKVRRAFSVEEALSRASSAITVLLAKADDAFVGRFKQTLARYQGGAARARLQLDLGEGAVELTLGDAWRLRAGLELKRELLALGGIASVTLTLDSRPLHAPADDEPA